MWLFRKKIHASDEELARAYYRAGEKEVLGDLFEKHVKTVYAVCLFYLRDREVARDAVMQIFEKLLIELRKREVSNFKGWLSFVVRNHCISEIRKIKRSHFVDEKYLDFELRDPDLGEEQRIDSVSEDQMLEHMRSCLDHLKPEQKMCVELFYLKDLSYEEVSKKTGLSMNEVKSRIQNGKRNLKLMIEEKIRNSDAA